MTDSGRRPTLDQLRAWIDRPTSKTSVEARRQVLATLDPQRRAARSGSHDGRWLVRSLFAAAATVTVFTGTVIAYSCWPRLEPSRTVEPELPGEGSPTLVVLQLESDSTLYIPLPLTDDGARGLVEETR